jgi:hypothetical protein
VCCFFFLGGCILYESHHPVHRGCFPPSGSKNESQEKVFHTLKNIPFLDRVIGNTRADGPKPVPLDPAPLYLPKKSLGRSGGPKLAEKKISVLIAF